MRPRPFHTGTSRGKRGFTFVELLVALVILGLLTSLGAGLLRLGTRSWAKTSRMSANILAIESAQSLLRATLSRARLTPAGDGGIRFDGMQDSVRFQAILPQALEQQGPVDIQIGAEAGGGGQLVMVWFDKNKNDWVKSVILSGIGSARFAYYGTPAEGVIPNWQSRWSGEKTLPQAIRLDVEFRAESSRTWPELIVAPMLTSDLSCLHNAAGEC
jgi:general secretion pathway protein J